MGPTDIVTTTINNNNEKEIIRKISVSKTFENSCILITGASGFLGKVLVEKLLYSIPSIKTIFLLIRPLRNETIKERLTKILQVKNFSS